MRHQTAILLKKKKKKKTKCSQLSKSFICFGHRKNATIVTNILFIAGAVLFLFCRAANSVEMLVVGRLLVGLAGG